jgi:integrase
VSNIQYLDEYYNKSVKDEFISEYSPATQKTISRIFKVSSKSEHDAKKDLYDFNRDQIRRLLFLYMPKTIGSSNLNLTWISKYLEWCILNSYLEGTNPLDGVSKEWAAQFVVSSNKKFWTEREIDKIIQKLENAQDGVIIRGLFENIKGSGCTELLNLRKKDINFSENKIRLYDSVDKKERIVNVSEKLIKLCVAALREEEYVKSRDISKDLKASPVIKLAMNDHIIRLAMTRSDDDFQQTDEHVVYRRLSNIAEGIGEPNFAIPMNLFYSGLIHKLFLAFQENPNITDEVYNKIFKETGEDSPQVQTSRINEFLNIETLKEVYKDELS